MGRRVDGPQRLRPQKLFPGLNPQNLDTFFLANLANYESLKRGAKDRNPLANNNFHFGCPGNHYFMNKNHNNEKAIKEKITAAVDSTFKNGYNLNIWTSSWLITTSYVFWKTTWDTRHGLNYQKWNVLFASKIIPRRKPCLTGTLKKRPTTVIKCNSPHCLDIFLNPKNVLTIWQFF